MIVILGSVEVRPDSLEPALALAMEHCARSRGEPGCVSHDCFQAVGRPHLLQFVEVWTDMVMVKGHFAVPESRTFVAQMGTFAASPPVMRVLQADEIG